MNLKVPKENKSHQIRKKLLRAGRPVFKTAIILWLGAGAWLTPSVVAWASGLPELNQPENHYLRTTLIEQFRAPRGLPLVAWHSRLANQEPGLTRHDISYHPLWGGRDWRYALGLELTHTDVAGLYHYRQAGLSLRLLSSSLGALLAGGGYTRLVFTEESGFSDISDPGFFPGSQNNISGYYARLGWHSPLYRFSNNLGLGLTGQARLSEGSVTQSATYGSGLLLAIGWDLEARAGLVDNGTGPEGWFRLDWKPGREIGFRLEFGRDPWRLALAVEYYPGKKFRFQASQNQGSGWSETGVGASYWSLAGSKKNISRATSENHQVGDTKTGGHTPEMGKGANRSAEGKKEKKSRYNPYRFVSFSLLLRWGVEPRAALELSRARREPARFEHILGKLPSRQFEVVTKNLARIYARGRNE